MSTFRDRLISDCTALAQLAGRKLTSLEIVGAADSLHAKMSKEKKRSGVKAEAEAIYALYPKKVGRDNALRAISKALDACPADRLTEQTKLFAECVRSWPYSYRYSQDGFDRCPHPASWYNAGRYADDPKEWRRAGAKSPAPAAHSHVAPPEPAGWRAAFPDFNGVDKPWGSLDPHQQAFILKTLGIAQETASQHAPEPQTLRWYEK